MKACFQDMALLFLSDWRVAGKGMGEANPNGVTFNNRKCIKSSTCDFLFVQMPHFCPTKTKGAIRSRSRLS